MSRARRVTPPSELPYLSEMELPGVPGRSVEAESPFHRACSNNRVTRAPTPYLAPQADLRKSYTL